METYQGKPGRPKRHDRRKRCQTNCLICGQGLDSNRSFCDARCRKRAQRERNKIVGL